ncbi:MAG: WD40 repeat domain-containing protein [Gammaproteobacteria bacterium]|nr:WD40 repeat domain-containing protein [Gammaproteobacteria bacterium]
MLKPIAESGFSSRHHATVLSIAFNSAGTLIVSGSEDESIKLWDLEGNCLQTFYECIFPGSARQPICAVAFTPNGESIVSGSKGAQVTIWNLEGKTTSFINHWGYANAVVFRPTELNSIAHSSRDNTIHFRNLEKHQQFMFEAHTDHIRTIAFSPNGQYLVSTSQDGSVKLWDLTLTDNYLQPSHFLRAYVQPPHRSLPRQIMALPVGCVFSSDGSSILSIATDGTFEHWGLDGSVIRRITPIDFYTVYSVAFSASISGTFIVCATHYGALRLSLLDNQGIYRCYGDFYANIPPVRPTSPVYSLAFSNDGQRLVAGRQNGTIELWDTSALQDYRLGQQDQKDYQKD